MSLYHFVVAPVVIYVIVQLIRGILRWQRYGMNETEIPSQIVSLAAGISVLWFPQSATLEGIAYPFGMSSDMLQFLAAAMLYISGFAVAGFLAQQAGAIDPSNWADPYPLSNEGRGSGIGVLKMMTAPIVQLFSISPLARQLRTQAAQYGLVGACGAAYVSPLLWKWFLDGNSGDKEQAPLLFGACCLLCILFGIFRWLIGANIMPQKSSKSTAKSTKGTK
jgi:hypothetical protein